MLIAYFSLSGNTRNFVDRLGMKSVEINQSNFEEINESFIIIVPSYDDFVTDIISDFIDYKDNLKYLKGFVGSGSLNYNNKFCFSAEELSKEYNKPLLFKFEFSGTDKDLVNFKKEVDKIEIA